ncbi:protein kinase [Angomonas deanei]|uniref:POLO box domain-containing protein n=1 Tax=Angomonas deanei TaxID=59799 RepID=A0A7G2C084_9TRYP|nr:protein kinase [Angomonas deanei]CAD2213130.1 hypothetical protein, conserved [Angomonas deanei]|eukprot:EPY35389.1 protein kinase [Angomonas deanei]
MILLLGRRSVSRRSSVSLLEANSDEGLLVRSSPDQYAVAYSGRENSTRWNLRPVISLPREFTADIEQEFKCMNNHVMTKLTSMPHGYNGFDCNVCDRGILKITADAPAFRCFKCDYDVCGKCAFSKRFKDVKIVCVSCGKKFVTTAKLQAHSLQCRGPSASPSPRSSSRMNTMLWDESKRPSLLEVQLPEDNTRRSGQKSGRPTYVRTSEGGRISIGNPKISSPEDMRDKVVPHKDANFPEVKKRGRPSKRRDSQAKSSDDSFSFNLPPEVELPEKKNKGMAQSRDSLQYGNREAKKDSTFEAIGIAPAEPPEYNDKGEIIGIAARRRAESVDMAEARGVVTIRADVAEKLAEVGKKHGVQSAPEGTLKRPRADDLISIPLRPEQRKKPQGSEQRGVSVNGMSVPLPRHGPGAPLPRSNFPTAAAVPPRNFMMRPSQYSMPNPMMAGPGRSMTPSRPLTKNNGAYLALPKEDQHKQQFLNEFLSGGWVRFYSFSNEDTVVMYYTLQPGRYGAMFPTEAGVGTAVLDVHSKLVLYVPCMNNESTSRSQPHPHVQTFYDEEARILTIAEAKRYLGAVLQCITAFVVETSRLKAEGLTPAAVHAAYIHQPNIGAVPRDTKFVYIRKVFPDPAGGFTLFRLSNLRSQVICNATLDIRWQSDRRHNVGQKYYVHSDGTAEPFVVDTSGILSEVETVLNNSYRR